MVVTPDLLGHGESDKPSESSAYGIPNMAADVVTLLDTLGQDASPRVGLLDGSVGRRSRPSRCPVVAIDQSGAQFVCPDPDALKA
jgi:hypothetical protein